MAKIKNKVKSDKILITCKLDGSESVNQAELSRICAPIIIGFAPVEAGSKKLTYTLPKYQNLTAWLNNPTDRASFYGIVLRVLDVIYAVENYGLNPNNLDINPGNVYLNNDKSRIFFVYYPITSSVFGNNPLSIFSSMVNSARLAFDVDNYKQEFFDFLGTQNTVSVPEFLKFIEKVSPGTYAAMRGLNMKNDNVGVTGEKGDADETVLLDEADIKLPGAPAADPDATVILDEADIQLPTPEPLQEVDPDATVLLDEEDVQLPTPEPVAETDPDATVILDEADIQLPTPEPVQEADPDATVILDEEDIQLPTPEPLQEADPDATVLLDEEDIQLPTPEPVQEADPDATVILDEADIQLPTPEPVQEADPDATVILDESEINLPTPEPVQEADPDATVILDESEIQLPTPEPVQEADPDATVILDESEINLPTPEPVQEVDPDETVILDESEIKLPTPEPQPAPEEEFDVTVAMDEEEIAEAFPYQEPVEIPTPSYDDALDATVPLDQSDYAPQPIPQEQFAPQEQFVPQEQYAAPQPVQSAPVPRTPQMAQQQNVAFMSDETMVLDEEDNYAPQESNAFPQQGVNINYDTNEYNSGNTVLLTDLPKFKLYLSLPKRKQEVEVTGSKFVIGADSACCDLAIDNSSISRMHLTVKTDGDDFYAVDNGSTNGTLYNGVPMKKGEPVKLNDLDRLVLANEIVDVKIVEENF